MQSANRRYFKPQWWNNFSPSLRQGVSITDAVIYNNKLIRIIKSKLELLFEEIYRLLVSNTHSRILERTIRCFHRGCRKQPQHKGVETNFI
jgi:hypothetical protein